MVIIQRDSTKEYLCGSSTTLPRWGTLERFSALLVFPDDDAADEYANTCDLTREEDITFLPIRLGE
jgi:hypothetical protein